VFSDYVYNETSAQYTDKLLLVDEDNLKEKTNFYAEFLSHGFEVINYTDDLCFRIEHEEKLKNSDNKLLVIAGYNQYIPYDIRKKLRVYSLSLSNLFPRLNANVLREKSPLDIDLLCLVYKSTFDNLHKRNQTEQFFHTTVYSNNNVKDYLIHVLHDIMLKINVAFHSDGSFSDADENEENNSYILNTKNALTYKDWFFIAEEKAKIDVLGVKYNIGIDTSDINRMFQEFVINEFGKLSQIIDKDTPVLLSRMMEYIHDHSSKFVLVVMDGMSEFDWNIISASFQDIDYEQTAAFAMIPSTTSISRQCLLSNKYPSQLIEPWKQGKEKYEFIACSKELGYTDEQIEYARGYDVEFGSFVRCGAVIINDVDDLVHAQHQGRLGMLNDISVLRDQTKLADMTKQFLRAGYDVYITADHGNTPCIGMGKLMGTGVEVETKSRRMLVLKDFADKETLIKKYGLIEYPKYYLLKDYDFLICNVGDSFDAKGEDVMTHGGLTLDEIIVPFIKIKVEQNNG